ncbi:MAG: hypothetical protein WDN72_09485 [Alphaproteobacteria bacterium]
MYPPRQAARFARNAGLSLSLVLLLSACGGHSSTTAANDQPGLAQSTASDTFNDAAAAVTSPLDDIGLRQKPIPAVLVQIEDNPYIDPSPKTCATIKDEVGELDTVLGSDVDAPKIILTRQQQMEHTGAGLLHDGIVGLVKSRLSFLPFRGVIRKITGADKHENEMKQAYEAGKLRRAYLKGLAQASFGKKCAIGPEIQEVKATPVKVAAPKPDEEDADKSPDALVPSLHVQVAARE